MKHTRELTRLRKQINGDRDRLELMVYTSLMSYTATPQEMVRFGYYAALNPGDYVAERIVQLATKEALERVTSDIYCYAAAVESLPEWSDVIGVLLDDANGVSSSQQTSELSDKDDVLIDTDCGTGTAILNSLRKSNNFETTMIFAVDADPFHCACTALNLQASTCMRGRHNRFPAFVSILQQPNGLDLSQLFIRICAPLTPEECADAWSRSWSEEEFEAKRLSIFDQAMRTLGSK